MTNREPPMYRVDPLAGSREMVDEEEEGTGPTSAAKQVSETVNQTLNWLFLGITWVILAVVLMVWAVVGAIFWIPLLIRAMLKFSISLIESIFEGHKPATAGKTLRDAVSFYRRGFVVAVEVVTREPLDGREEGPVKENRLLLEVLWALLVWYFIALLFGWIQASPLDLWDWLASIPWGEYFGDLLRRFRT
jgi:hypothetical protein